MIAACDGVQEWRDGVPRGAYNGTVSAFGFFLPVPGRHARPRGSCMMLACMSSQLRPKAAGVPGDVLDDAACACWVLLFLMHIHSCDAAAMLRYMEPR